MKSTASRLINRFDGFFYSRVSLLPYKKHRIRQLVTMLNIHLLCFSYINPHSISVSTGELVLCVLIQSVLVILLFDFMRQNALSARLNAILNVLFDMWCYAMVERLKKKKEKKRSKRKERKRNIKIKYLLYYIYIIYTTIILIALYLLILIYILSYKLRKSLKKIKIVSDFLSLSCLYVYKLDLLF